jgi:hypothetical protein
MSVYYCDYHQTFHDNDYHPCVEHPTGSNLVICEEAGMEIEEQREEAMKPNNNRAFSPAQQAFIRKMEAEDYED